VTTRRRNLWALTNLRRARGALAARTFRLGVLGFDLGVLATFGLPPSGLPAANLALAFRLLAGPLVAGPRLVLAPAPFAQAGPRAQSAPSGRTAVLCRTLARTHRRCLSQGKSSGRM
jgi:hypothetical protein